jgi:hypothetical protein
MYEVNSTVNYTNYQESLLDELKEYDSNGMIFFNQSYQQISFYLNIKNINGSVSDIWNKSFRFVPWARENLLPIFSQVTNIFPELMKYVGRRKSVEDGVCNLVFIKFGCPIASQTKQRELFKLIKRLELFVHNGEYRHEKIFGKRADASF